MTLVDLLKLLRKRILLVVGLPLVFALGVAGVSWGTLQDQYTATISAYVLSASSEDDIATRNDDLSASQLIANDIAEIADSPVVLDCAANELGLSSLSGYNVKVSSSSTTRLIDISVTGGNDETAEAIANAMPEVLNSVSQDVIGDVSVSSVGSAKVAVISSEPRCLDYTIVAFLSCFVLTVAAVLIENRVRLQGVVHSATGENSVTSGE